MNPIKLILVFTLFFTIFSCEQTQKKQEEKQVVKEDLVEIKDGHYKEWYPGKKQLKYEGDLTQKGDREGKWNYYSDNGNLLSFTFYVAGKKNGHSVVKYPNGKIHYYGQYKDDQMVGEWVTYDEKGNKTVNTFNP
jgi:antitoxin component YwqK of YwqJK toxin-antitoxin module